MIGELGMAFSGSKVRCKDSILAAARRFASREDGAITIDWVAITAGVLLLGITLVYALYNNGVASTSSSINSSLISMGSGVDTGAPPSQESFAGGAGSGGGSTGGGADPTGSGN